jgi:MFS superfamily sulfate permease-like transporter
MPAIKMNDNSTRTSPSDSSDTTLSNVIRHDLPASVVVFLVALPLCMGIAIASGAPVAAGLITGIVGGLVVALLAGAPLQASGPAAGLTVIVYEAIQRHGLEMLGLIVLLAGVFQFAAGTFRLAQWFRAVSPAVIKGMLSGIGVLIFASQFHVMVDDAPKGSGLQNLATIPQSVRKALNAPHLVARQDRAYRMRALQEIGELHRQQLALETQVEGVLPDHRDEESLADRSPEEVAADAAGVESLAPRQTAIQDRLQQLVQRLQDYEPQQNDERAAAIRGAADAALVAVERSRDEMHQGRTSDVVASQQAAVHALSQLQGTLKHHSVAAQIGLLTILLIVGWQALAPKRLKVIPAPLAAVMVATTVAVTMSLPILYVEVPDNLLEAVHMPTWKTVQDAEWAGILQSALVVAVVASAETLLCAIAVDQMHDGPRTRFDRELVAQGVGNTVCGLFGALPMTGVIVRSSANVQAGARTRWSAFFHGVWLLVFVSLLAWVLRMVPTAGLAAILVYTGFKLINFKAIRELRQFGRGEVVIFLATVGVIVVEDLLTGVMTGVVLSGVKLLYTFSHLKIGLNPEEDRKATLSLEGAATFLRLPKLAAKLEEVPANTELHVDLTHLDYIDHACLDLLTSWGRQHEATGGKLVIDWEAMHSRSSREPQDAARTAALRRSA